MVDCFFNWFEGFYYDLVGQVFVFGFFVFKFVIVFVVNDVEFFFVQGLDLFFDLFGVYFISNVLVEYFKQFLFGSVQLVFQVVVLVKGVVEFGDFVFVKEGFFVKYQVFKVQVVIVV